MKFYCKQEDILNEIAFAMDFTQQKNSLSILSNIYLETKDDILTIRSTDTASGFTTQIPVQTVEEGSTIVFGEKFLDTLRLLPNTTILFAQKDNVLKISPEDSTVKFNSTLKVMDASDFPELESADADSFFTIGQKAFITMSDQTSFSVGTDETRQFLCGLYLEKSPVGMNMVATDSRRLSLVERKFSENIPDFKPVIIPVKFFNELKKLAPGDGVMDLCIKEHIIFAKIAKRFFYTTLIKSAFPDYRRVIPQQQTHHCTLKIKDTIDAIKRVAVSIDSRVCKIYLEIAPNQMTLFSEGNEIGDAKETLDCQYDGETTTICLNYIYLVSPLKVMEGETFTFNFTDPLHPVTLCPEGEHDYFHLIMPMQPGV